MTTPTTTPNARLKELMDLEPDLTRPMVGKICGRTKACVDMWLRPMESIHWRPMPDYSVRLLEFELGYRTPRYTRYHRGVNKHERREQEPQPQPQPTEAG